jgi:capsular exopolysaccharide synthesis family protein
MPTPAELAHAIKRRAVLAGFLGVLAGAGAAAGVWFALPGGKHQVRALVQMKPVVPVLGRPGPDTDFDSFKQTQVILLRTRALLTRVTSNPKVSRLPMIQERDDPVRYLEDQLKVDWKSPEVLTVTMAGDEPDQMKVVLDTLLAEYLEDARSDEFKHRERKRKLLEGIRDDLDKRIKYGEGRLQSLSKAGVGAVPEATAAQANSLGQQLTAVNADIGRITQDARVIELRLADEKAALASAAELPVDPADLDKIVQSAPAVREKAEERAAREAELRTLRGQLTPGNPGLKAAEADFRKADDELKKAAEAARPAATEELRALMRRELQARAARTEDALKDRQRERTSAEEARKGIEEKLRLLTAGGTDARLEDEELRPLKEQRNLINKELVDLTISDKAETRVSLLEEAVVIPNHNLKQKLILAGGAGVAGLGLVLALVALAEWRSRRVDSVSQVVDELGIRVIGTIPAFPTKAALAAGGDREPAWRLALTESVNSARTMLLYAAKSHSMQVIMVTSATQGEGKTSLASQLGTSMAAAGLRTLILDCDLRNPSLHSLFGAQLSPGCAEVLCQEVDVSDAVQPTTVANLWLIPAGQSSARVIAALAQGHPLDALFNRLRGQFDFVVVDSCPVLPVADALLVGQHVDGVVISIMQDVSQLPKVLTASEKLTQLNIPLLGAVVNGIRPDGHAYGYNYVKQLPA